MSEIRQRYLAHFRALAQDIFARHPEYRSVVLAVSQYWADEANDAVHDCVIASERDLPVWPHVCQQSSYSDDPVEDNPTEHCNSYSNPELYDGYLTWWHDNGEAISAFEAFCHESGTQDEPDAYNALPAAIARRAGDTVDVSLLGPVQRPHAILGDADLADPDPMWDDPRALELYAQVCAAPRDDGPRRVLADYLLEREIPRGELIAYGLEPTARAKCDELIAASGGSWTHPLKRCIPLETAKLERGFLAEAELWLDEDTAFDLRGLPVWNSLERLFVHPKSACILDPGMRALRELGRLDEAWLLELLAVDRPWAIETLDIDVETATTFDLLTATTLLPALRHLVISYPWVEDEGADQIVTARWWSQLERLTIIDGRDTHRSWQARRAQLGVPWLAVRNHHVVPATTDGWELAFGPDGACEVALRGFTPHATREALAALLAKVEAPAVRLVPSRYYLPAQPDADYLSRGGRVVTL